MDRNDVFAPRVGFTDQDSSRTSRSAPARRILRASGSRLVARLGRRGVNWLAAPLALGAAGLCSLLRPPPARCPQESRGGVSLVAADCGLDSPPDMDVEPLVVVSRFALEATALSFAAVSVVSPAGTPSTRLSQHRRQWVSMTSPEGIGCRSRMGNSRVGGMSPDSDAVARVTGVQGKGFGSKRRRRGSATGGNVRCLRSNGLE